MPRKTVWGLSMNKYKVKMSAIALATVVSMCSLVNVSFAQEEGNVPKKLGSYNNIVYFLLKSHKDGSVPKKLGSYNSRSSSGWCFRTMVMFPRGWKVENRFEGQDP